MSNQVQENPPIEALFWLIGLCSMLVLIAIIVAILDYKEEKKKMDAFVDLVGYSLMLYLLFKSRKSIPDNPPKKSS
jgi:hypothetical protein